MGNKFGRNYILEVGTSSGQTITIQLPFSVEFDITRNTLTSANVCQIRIYNLSEKNRNLIRFNISNFGELRPITFKAGYGQNTPIIFTGNISEAWSVREGVDFITQIECYDGGFAFANGSANVQFPENTLQKDVISTLAGLLPNVDLGAIGNYPGQLSRGNSYSGSTMDLLRELTGGGAFIDNGLFNALGNNEYIENLGGIPLINSQSGLLGTPVLEETIVKFDMIFEPNLKVGQRIQLVSITGANFNGFYKVIGVKHRGMISESVCGEAITSGEFFYSEVLSPVVSNG